MSFTRLEQRETIMENKDVRTEARLIVSELLTEPVVAKYISQLKIEQPYTFRHSINVAYLVAEVCLSKLPTDNMKDIVSGALLHDIGKLKVPTAILTKPDKLTDEEFDQIKLHPIYGYRMLKEESISQLTKNIVLLHHEKPDGMGYPYHYKDDTIPKDVKIVTACDIYDALTENRCYRPDVNYSSYDALKILAEKECIEDIIYLLLALCPDK